MTQKFTFTKNERTNLCSITSRNMRPRAYLDLLRCAVAELNTHMAETPDCTCPDCEAARLFLDEIAAIIPAITPAAATPGAALQ